MHFLRIVIKKCELHFQEYKKSFSIGEIKDVKVKRVRFRLPQKQAIINCNTAAN